MLQEEWGLWRSLVQQFIAAKVDIERQATCHRMYALLHRVPPHVCAQMLPQAHSTQGWDPWVWANHATESKASIKSICLELARFVETMDSGRIGTIRGGAGATLRMLILHLRPFLGITERTYEASLKDLRRACQGEQVGCFSLEVYLQFVDQPDEEFRADLERTITTLLNNYRPYWLLRHC